MQYVKALRKSLGESKSVPPARHIGFRCVVGVSYVASVSESGSINAHDVFLNWGLWQRGRYPHSGLVNVPQTPHHVSNKTQMPVIAVSLSAEVQRYQTRLSFTATFGHHSCTPMVPVDSRGTNDFLLVFHCDRRSGWNRYPVIDGKPSKSADSNHHE